MVKNFNSNFFQYALVVSEKTCATPISVMGSVMGQFHYATGYINAVGEWEKIIITIMGFALYIHTFQDFLIA